MKLKFHTDNAAPCWKCAGTIATYNVDTEVSIIGVLCVSCKTTDIFCAPTGAPLGEASQVSAAHRQVCGTLNPYLSRILKGVTNGLFVH